MEREREPYKPIPLTEKQTLKPNAIGFVGGLVIGLASTAPAYSLAAVIGSLVVIVALQAPAALLLSFVPMFLIAGAFFYMNRADPDAGTTFSWVTRALGPWAGWIGGWAVCVTGILVVGSLADVGARYLYLLVGWDSAAGSKEAVTALAVVIVLVMTAICILGTELSARIQNVMILAQVGALLLFATVALVKVYSGDATVDSIEPQASWFNPFEINSTDDLYKALLIGVFIYWGWESAVNLTEETEDSRRAPGLAAIVSTVVLVVTYVSVGTAVVAFAGLEALGEYDDDDAIFGVLAGDVLGSPWDKLVLLAIATSAISSTQTTIIPASRTTLSMARSRAYPSGPRADPRALSHSPRRDGRRRAARSALVRARELPVGELPLRLAHGARADDRVLLRAERHRLRRVLPARAHEIGEELPPDGRRPDRRRAHPQLSCSSRRPGRSPTSTRRTRDRPSSVSRRRSRSGTASCCSGSSSSCSGASPGTSPSSTGTRSSTWIRMWRPAR